MYKLKEVEKYFGEQCWRIDGGQKLAILSCALGDNFYDYGEAPKEELDLSNVPSQFSNLFNDDRIVVIECCDCCGCSGW